MKKIRVAYPPHQSRIDPLHGRSYEYSSNHRMNDPLHDKDNNRL
jgi:hypothetical protein